MAPAVAEDDALLGAVGFGMGVTRQAWSRRPSIGRAP